MKGLEKWMLIVISSFYVQIISMVGDIHSYLDILCTNTFYACQCHNLQVGLKSVFLLSTSSVPSTCNTLPRCGIWKCIVIKQLILHKQLSVYIKVEVDNSMWPNQ